MSVFVVLSLQFGNPFAFGVECFGEGCAFFCLLFDVPHDRERVGVVAGVCLRADVVRYGLFEVAQDLVESDGLLAHLFGDRGPSDREMCPILDIVVCDAWKPKFLARYSCRRAECVPVDGEHVEAVRFRMGCPCCSDIDVVMRDVDVKNAVSDLGDGAAAAEEVDFTGCEFCEFSACGVCTFVCGVAKGLAC